MNNPQVVRFCNEGLRPTANALASAYYSAKKLVADYDSTGILPLLGDVTVFTDLVSDGHDVDGRPPISAGGVAVTIANLRSLITQIETTDVNGLSLIAGVLSISPRYQG